MMKKSEQRRKLFFRQRGKCIWCGQQMILPENVRGKAPDNMATLEHMYDRKMMGRGNVPWKTHKVACKKCNETRQNWWPLDR